MTKTMQTPAEKATPSFIRQSVKKQEFAVDERVVDAETRDEKRQLTSPNSEYKD